MASTSNADEFVARLGRARRTIEEGYATSVVGRRTARLLARIERSLSRPFRVVVLGEANSGKTTLINHILGNDLLATDVIQNTRSAVLVRYATQPLIELREADGRRHPIKPGSGQGLVVGPGATIEVGVPLSRLATMEIVDTPGLTDGDPGAERAAWRKADIAVWCTIATQAWRASEIAAWRSLGRRPATSLLAVTRTDLLGEVDRGKVAHRLAVEAGPMFRAVVLVAGGPAQTGAAIAVRLDEIVAQLRQARRRKATGIVRRLARRLDASEGARSDLALVANDD
jgi:GTPase Era involved in 16S rRNA processing